MGFAPSWPTSLSTAMVFFLSFPTLADDRVHAVVDSAVEPVMAAHGIPGMSVAILVGGQRYVFHYGVSSRATREAVDDKTIFEIGSLTKAFTGTLGGVLQAEGSVDLSAKAQSLMDELQGSPLGDASLLQLATYNAGGLPLQFPDGVDETNVANWFREFVPGATTGASRLYSNPSIGLFGNLTAKAAGSSFADLLRAKILSPLELSDTFLTVPQERVEDYAQGYTRDDEPVRVNPGLFDEEAYGIKTTALDFLQFVEASMSSSARPAELARGLETARSGVYRVKAMHQGLGWELYPAPARLEDLIQGADPEFILKPNSVEAADAPVTYQRFVGTVSKTGSTGGFGAYTLFSPENGTAIIMLANRIWPNSERIETAYTILSELDPEFGAD